MKKKINRWKFHIGIFISLIILITGLFQSSTAQIKKPAHKELLLRGDDMGITHATNMACIKAYRDGIEKSVEVIVPSPWFPEAVKLLKENPGLDVGVHLALTSEWETVKWRPLTHCPSLTDSNGYFFPVIWPTKDYGKNRALRGHHWKIKEIEKEFRKQIEIAKMNLPNVTHLSYHMGCNDISPQVHEMVNRLAKEYGLYVDMTKVHNVNYDGPHKTPKEKISSFIKMLKNIKPGVSLFIDHPSLNTPEMRAVYMKGYRDVAEDRQGVTDLYTSKVVKKALIKYGITLISYKDLKQSEGLTEAK